MTTREQGKAPFPLSRVQRIIKADKEMGTVAKEGVVLIAVATELFLQRIAKASSQVAKGEKRVTVQNKDVGLVVKRSEEYHFLRDILLRDTGDAADKDKGKTKKKKEYLETGDDDRELGEGELPGEPEPEPEPETEEVEMGEDGGEDSEPLVHDSDSDSGRE